MVEQKQILKQQKLPQKPLKHELNKKYGLLLWLLLVFGYFLFVINWVLMNKLAGSVADHNGWINTFFTSKPSKTTSEAINYTITAMRGIGAIGAGWLLVKIGHKYAVIVALALLSISLPTIFMPTYALFIIGRMLMAIGGTIIIIYTQPIISRYFNQQQRPILSRINPVGFNLGAAIPLILFAINPVRNLILQDWKITASIIAVMPFILLIIYWIFGKPIEIRQPSDPLAEKLIETKEAEKTHQKTEKISAIIKEKTTWKMIIFFGAWLIAAVGPILILAIPIQELHHTNLGKAYQPWEVYVPIILFLLGSIPGIWLVGWISKTNYNRTTYIALMIGIAIFLLLGAYLSAAYIKSSIPVMIFMFFGGMILWGIQGPTLNIPHEMKGNSPQRVSLIIGLIWGGGYLIYTIVNIIITSILDAGGIGEPLTIWLALGVYFGFLIIMLIVALFLPKTKNKPLRTIFKAGIHFKKSH